MSDEDTHSHMSDTPLQLPTSANVATNNSASVTFSQAEGDFMRNVASLHPIPSQTGVNPWQIQYPSAFPHGSPAVLGPQETVQLVTQRAREALTVQGEALRVINKETFSLPLLNTKRLRGQILSVFRQEMM